MTTYDGIFNDDPSSPYFNPNLAIGTGVLVLNQARAAYVLAPSTFSSFSSGGPGNVSTVTGVNANETSYALYGHTVPLSVFGVGRIGGDIIAGPWFANGNSTASFIISFGVPADPGGARVLREIAFDSEVVWNEFGFTTEPFSYRFYQGTLTQSADLIEHNHFGVNACAYRPQMLLCFDNLPLANTKFKKIPYVSAVIADTSGDDVNLGEAFERLAYSPWVGYTSSQFETVGITDGLVNGGLIFADQSEFLGTIQQFGRFYPKWDILQTDKLRIVDRGSDVTPDVILDRTRLKDQVTLARSEPNSVPSILKLSTIDPDADYTIVESRAQSPRDPVAVSASVKTDSAYLPAIMDSATRISLVTYAKHDEDRARKTISVTAMAYGLEIEPGALVGIDGLGDDFPGGETFRVIETLHGQNYTVEFTAKAVLQCTVSALVEPPPTIDPGPLPLTGMIAWWDASVFDSLTLQHTGTGTEIIGMVDQTGNGNDLGRGFSGTPNYQPTAINSAYPGIIFQGNAQESLKMDNFPMGTGNTLTVFAVATMTSGFGTSDARLVSYTSSTHDYDNLGSFAIKRNGTATNLQMERHNALTGAMSFATGLRRIIVTVKSDGTMTTYIDGVASTTATASGNWVSGGHMVVGGAYINDANIFHGYWGGVIGEVGISSDYADAATVATLDAYLVDKWLGGSGGGGGSGSVSTTIITEDSEDMITEDSDTIVTEG